MASAVGLGTFEKLDIVNGYKLTVNYDRTIAGLWEKVPMTAEFTKAVNRGGHLNETEIGKCCELASRLNEYHNTVASEKGLTQKTQAFSHQLFLDYQKFKRENPAISIKNFTIGH